MSYFRRTLIALPAVVAALGFCPPAWADEAPYITPRQVDLRILLPPPPSPDSPLQRAELEAALAAQREASPERIALAVADAKETVYDMFARTLGPNFDPSRLPKTTELFARIGASEDATVDPAKAFFGRVRPFLADERVKALVPPSKSGSWPSGHTTRVTMEAIVLAAMLPEYKQAIWTRAGEYARSRVIGGVHYPLDLDAGGRAGTAMAAVLFTDPAFLADFAAAKEEVRGVMVK